MTAIAEFRAVSSLASSASVYRAGRRARMFMHYPLRWESALMPRSDRLPREVLAHSQSWQDCRSCTGSPRAQATVLWGLRFPDCGDPCVRFIRFWPGAGLAQLVSCSISRLIGK